MIAIDRDVLREALAGVRPFIKSRVIMPVLECVRVSAYEMADDGYITLQGTDMEQAISLRVPAKIQADIDVCLPMKLLSDFVANLPGGNIIMAVTGNSVTLECAGHKARIKHYDANDFPVMPPIDCDPVDVDADELRSAITLGSYAAARDVSRPSLLAGLLYLDPVRVVSVDGFRLAIAPEGQDDPEQGIMVPATTLQTVGRLIDGICAVKHDDRYISFETDTAMVTALLINGKFPDYRAIIPTSHTTSLTVSRVDLLGAVNLAMLFARDSSNIVRLSVGDKLIVRGASAESGDGVTVLDAAVNGDVLEWAVNGAYLRQTLDVYECDAVTIELTSAARSMVVRGDALAVIMPMHINE